MLSIPTVFTRLRELLYSYRAEFLIALSTAIAGAIVGAVLTKLLDVADTTILVVTIFGTLILTMLGLLLFNLKRLFNKRATAINNMLSDLFGYTWQNNQFFIRKRHFTMEKDLLCRELVYRMLPRLLQEILKTKNHGYEKVNIILDSGTTISPVFRYLPISNLKKTLERYNVSCKVTTNNLAGIGELHRLDPALLKFTEEDFYLVGGNPLGKYRATTERGRASDYLKNLWGAEKTCNISIVTANWILAGVHLNNLILCARGRGHPEFKLELVMNSTYIIVVAPLGKILRLPDNHSLNALLPSGQLKYDTVEITPEYKSHCSLLTTFRHDTSNSLLRKHSKALQTRQEMESKTGTYTKNFIFSKELLFFEPQNPMGDLPHDYIREKLNVAFQLAFEPEKNPDLVAG